MEACFDGNARVVRLLLKWGGDVNAKCRDGRTPLMYAAGRNQENCAKVLLARKPDLMIKNDEGHTAWDVAHRGSAYAVRYWLEKRGGRPSEKAANPPPFGIPASRNIAR